MVGVGTNHRLSLAQNPVLLAGQITSQRAVCNAADQMAALVGLEVAQRPHDVHYTITSQNHTTQTPPLGAAPRSPLRGRHNRLGPGWVMSAPRQRPRWLIAALGVLVGAVSGFDLGYTLGHDAGKRGAK